MRAPQLSALVLLCLPSVPSPRNLRSCGRRVQPESAVFDRAPGAIYVSNVNGDPMKKDGNGFIKAVR
jgi:hypothetical protein